MSKIQIDFSKSRGRIKPMHAVNNAPSGSMRSIYRTNYDLFRRAHIPYCRSHDASFYFEYGGEFTVDVHRIFRDFNADVNDPASYLFSATDRYIKSIYAVGAEPFFRLGASIEHNEKDGTIPPKDNLKWAQICEHIIMHYNEGWADGFNYNIKYWEIWNEPECTNSDGTHPCWQGTFDEFIEFYVTVHGHLKNKFPDLKIGGPAFCSTFNVSVVYPFFTALKNAGIKPDFYSFHGYCNNAYDIRDMGYKADSLTKEFGWDGVELILNEWNLVEGWDGKEYIDTLRAIKGLKSSSFIAASMMMAQNSPIDMFMYYDARPSDWCGMFDTTFLTPLKGYYPFEMFGALYLMGEEVESVSDDIVLNVVAARNNGNSDECGMGGCMMTYYDCAETCGEKDVTLTLANIPLGTNKLEYYLLDEAHDMTLMRTETLASGVAGVTVDLHLDLFATVFIKLL